MTITLLIIVYLLNVFLNRWLNKMMCKKYNEEVDVGIWFIPIFGTFICLLNFLLWFLDDKPESLNWIYKLQDRINKLKNKFTGKHWK